MKKTTKITTNTNEFFSIIEKKIKDKLYVLTFHAKQRSKQRHILDEEILNILEGKPGYTRHWNKRKDSYGAPFYSAQETWNYCIDGKTPDKDLIRVIVTFEDDLMPIITVIRL